ncbi:MotA/TolQ/ExbB proton channel family protein [bacterium]|nr:MotA/TolQ/ExbB proton channel family protein [bacterium]
MYFLPLLAQVQAEKTIANKSQLDLILEADPVVKLTLILLLAASVISWAIIFFKYRQIKSAQNLSQDFWGTFAKADSFQDVARASNVKDGPLFEIYNSAILFLPRIKKTARSNASMKDAIGQKLAQAREEEVYKLEQHIPFLATTASTAPFVGLFGTVWGILSAFYNIGKAGSSSLATVGPYISEALIATAIGLAAAIPAVVAYNFFVNKIRIINKMMDLFVDDLVLKIEEENP